MTVDQMVEDVAGAIDYDTVDSTQAAQVLRWLNDAQVSLADMYDWPELVTRDATLTTTGSETYNLTTGAGMPGSTFCRIIDQSLKLGFYNLRLRPKSWMDETDPDRSLSVSTAYFFDLPKRTDLRIFPAHSSGVTLTFDWVAYATALAAGGAESSISFDKSHHNLIVDGAIWRGERYTGDPKWREDRQLWEHDVKQSFRRSSVVRPHGKVITNIDF